MADDKALQVLDRMRGLFIGVRWCKGKSAKDQHGRDTDPRSPDATCWCLAGATLAVTKDNGDSCAADDYLVKAAQQLFPGRLDNTTMAFMEFNDHPDTTFDDVLRVIDHATDLAEAALRGTR